MPKSPHQGILELFEWFFRIYAIFSFSLFLGLVVVNEWNFLRKENYIGGWSAIGLVTGIILYYMIFHAMEGAKVRDALGFWVLSLCLGFLFCYEVLPAFSLELDTAVVSWSVGSFSGATVLCYSFYVWWVDEGWWQATGFRLRLRILIRSWIFPIIG